MRALRRVVTAAKLVVRDAHGILWLLPGTATGYGERRFLAAGAEDYSFIG